MKAAINTRQNNKVTRYRYPQRRPYPNAAERRYYVNKALDYALAAATGLGAVVIMLFFVTLA